VFSEKEGNKLVQRKTVVRINSILMHLCLFRDQRKKITDLFGDEPFYFSVCVLVFFLSSSFRKKEQELDGQKKVTCLLLPIDFPVPFSGSLVSRNYSSAFSGSLGWDISHCGGLTVPRSPRGRLER